jgi:hypothetical protein
MYSRSRELECTQGAESQNVLKEQRVRMYSRSREIECTQGAESQNVLKEQRVRMYSRSRGMFMNIVSFSPLTEIGTQGDKGNPEKCKHKNPNSVTNW